MTESEEDEESIVEDEEEESTGEEVKEPVKSVCFYALDHFTSYWLCVIFTKNTQCKIIHAVRLPQIYYVQRHLLLIEKGYFSCFSKQNYNITRRH